MLADELREELRELIRFEVDAVVSQHLRAAFGSLLKEGLEPIVAGVAELLNDRQRLASIEESLSMVVEGQANIELALAENADPDVNAPWRQSLDDVILDDSED